MNSGRMKGGKKGVMEWWSFGRLVGEKLSDSCPES